MEQAALLLAIVDTCCWGICFWWMHRVSVRQDSMLAELHAMTGRVERLAKEEHELISEVHPVVERIHASVENVKEAVTNEEPAAAEKTQR